MTCVNIKGGVLPDGWFYSFSFDEKHQPLPIIEDLTQTPNFYCLPILAREQAPGIALFASCLVLQPLMKPGGTLGYLRVGVLRVSLTVDIPESLNDLPESHSSDQLDACRELGWIVAFGKESMEKREFHTEDHVVLEIY